jgi:hypothetical protein
MNAIDLTNIALDNARVSHAQKLADAQLNNDSRFQFQGIVRRFSGNMAIVQVDGGEIETRLESNGAIALGQTVSVSATANGSTPTATFLNS